MKTFAVSEALLANAVRTRGFTWTILAGAAALLSLPVTTGFGLGRELLMIREASFGTIFVFPFACALLACHTNSGRALAGWRALARTMVSGNFHLTSGFVLHSVLAGTSSMLFLAPFLAASLCFFHGAPASGLLCTAAGAATAAIAFGSQARRGFSAPLFFAPAIAGAAAAAAALLTLPDGPFLASLLAFTLVPVALLGGLAGSSCAAFPGPSGLILAVFIFVAGNMGDSLGSGALGIASRLLPDLAAMNPSLISSSSGHVPAASLVFAGLYSFILVVAALSAAYGLSSLKEEPA